MMMLISILLLFLFDVTTCTPCSSDDRCDCLPNLSLVDCTGKNLAGLPDMTTEVKGWTKVLILNNNKITSITDFIPKEWKLLSALSIKRNPIDICIDLNALKKIVPFKIIDDCPDTLTTTTTENMTIIHGYTEGIQEHQTTGAIITTTESGFSVQVGWTDRQITATVLVPLIVIAVIIVIVARWDTRRKRLSMDVSARRRETVTQRSIEEAIGYEEDEDDETEMCVTPLQPRRKSRSSPEPSITTTMSEESITLWNIERKYLCFFICKIHFVHFMIC